jgi:hypothetical protein
MHSWDISNNSSFRQKHPGVPGGSDGSDETLYPLTENVTLSVAQAMGRSLLECCGALQVPPITVEQSGKTTSSSLGTVLVWLEIIATTHHSTIFKTHEIGLYLHLCIYVSI